MGRLRAPFLLGLGSGRSRITALVRRVATSSPPGASISLIVGDELGAAAPCDIDVASRARDIVSRRLSATEHVSRVSHLFVVDALHQPVGECVAAEVAPKIPAAAEDLAVPIDLGRVPELMANLACELFSVLLLILFTTGRLPSGPGAYKRDVADG